MDNMPFLHNGVRLRWFNTAGFEIALPGGAHILVDPWLDSADIHPFPLEQIQRADYLLLSHIHFDHAQDVQVIQERFPGVKILVGDLSADPLCAWQRINVNRLYRVRSGERYDFDDLSVQTYAGRHTESARGVYREDNVKDGKLDLSMWYGSLEMLSFLVTAADGTRVLIWGGMTSPDQTHRLRGLRPNIALMHVSPKQDFGEFAGLVDAVGAQVVIPHHYDLLEPLFQQHPGMMQDMSPENRAAFVVDGKFRTQRYLEALKQAVEAQAPTSTLLTLEHHRWYRFGFCCREE